MKITNEELFSELRSLLQKNPSEELWLKICKNIDLWDLEKLSEIGLPYASAHLVRWPENVWREAPTRWVRKLLAGEKIPKIAIVGRLILESKLKKLNIATFFNNILFSKLFYLDLSKNKINDDDMDLVFSLEKQNILAISFSYNKIGDVGLTKLAKSPILLGVEYLDFKDNNIGSNGIKALASSDFIRRLYALDLSGNNIGNSGAKEIANSINFSNLKELVLDHNGVGFDGISALASSVYMSNLEELWIFDDIDDRSAIALAASPHMKNLKLLRLCDDYITDIGAAALAKSPYLCEEIRAEWRR
jgi:Ran GTPase-activating protein (RanGAP) involved in mRNA processing and transport